MNSARGLKSAVLLHQNLILCTVEGDRARAAQKVKISAVEEMNATSESSPDVLAVRATVYIAMAST
jgi:hypothetical protein